MSNDNKKTVYLISNAHIDPVWQWDVAEGIGVALSTFRSAVCICEENEDFIFNHNEALLYKWVEEFDPLLFKRIKDLVKAGRWNIIGGFELQPDCVMPCGESYIRQILRGSLYFEERFGIQVKTAVNFDSFGHSRGLVQILKKSGYDSYVFMRPEAHKADLPTDFIWRGFDGSEIKAHRITTGYNSLLGENRKELENWIASRKLQNANLYPWGVGNHGGGPSRKDISDIAQLKAENKYPDVSFVHSTPEEFFEDIQKQYTDNKKTKKYIDKSLYSSNVGCYTSMVEIKQGHRKLENKLIQAEKLATLAFINGYMEYPSKELDEAWAALAFIQFHDVLPGTHTLPVMKSMMELCGYGLTIAQKIINRVFYLLSANVSSAQEGVIPIIVVNPHPYKIEQELECEYILQNQNWDDETLTVARIYKGGDEIPCQLVKEDSSIPLDWRKKVVFRAELEPFAIEKYDCHMKVIEKSVPVQTKKQQKFVFENQEMSLEIGAETGLIESFIVDGCRLTGRDFGQICVFEDDEDPWHMRSDQIQSMLFTLPLVDSVRITEDGPVKTVVESCFANTGITAVLRYHIPRKGSRIRIDVEITNTLPCRCVKMCFPAADPSPELICDTMFGSEKGFTDGTEIVSQKFDILKWDDTGLVVINDGIYGGSFKDGVLYKNLLRSPAFCAHPIGDRAILKENVYAEHMGIGVYRYSFLLFPAGRDYLYDASMIAQQFNEKVLAVSCFPPGYQRNIKNIFPIVQGVVMTAMKKADRGEGIIIRLYNPADRLAEFGLTIGNDVIRGKMHPFEVKTLRYTDNNFRECSMIEN